MGNAAPSPRADLHDWKRMAAHYDLWDKNRTPSIEDLRTIWNTAEGVVSKAIDQQDWETLEDMTHSLHWAIQYSQAQSLFKRIFDARFDRGDLAMPTDEAWSPEMMYALHRLAQHWEYAWDRCMMLYRCDDVRAAAARALDRFYDYLAKGNEHRYWQATTDAIRKFTHEPLRQRLFDARFEFGDCRVPPTYSTVTYDRCEMLVRAYQGYRSNDVLNVAYMVARQLHANVTRLSSTDLGMWERLFEKWAAEASPKFRDGFEAESNHVKTLRARIQALAESRVALIVTEEKR